VPYSGFHSSAGPADCPFGHFFEPGTYQRSWMPCICPPALETGLGGHRVWQCNACDDELRQTICYVPPHRPAPGQGPLTASPQSSG
jgi:hypothetical protein